MIFLRPLAINKQKQNTKFVCNLAPVKEYDVFRSATDVAESISLIQTIASIGRLAHEDTSLLNFFRQILTLEIVFSLLNVGGVVAQEETKSWVTGARPTNLLRHPRLGCLEK